jgi:hypothetical protein
VQQVRKLLSRVEAVFQIAGRGCVVAPGIPRNAESHVKIGDQLWIERPDGSQTSTVVRGIEMGGSIDATGIAILLGGEISKDDVPIGTRLLMEFAPVGSFTLSAHSANATCQFDQLFKTDDEGHLQFGWSGKSRSISSTADIQKRPIEFTDYLMEGFVSYHVLAVVQRDLLVMTVSLHGTARDQYLRSHIAFHVQQAGFTLDT